jgi:hypothetical protein
LLAIILCFKLQSFYLIEESALVYHEIVTIIFWGHA